MIVIKLPHATEATVNKRTQYQPSSIVVIGVAVSAVAIDVTVSLMSELERTGEEYQVHRQDLQSLHCRYGPNVALIWYG